MVIAIAGLALLAAACGDSPTGGVAQLGTSTTPSGSPTPRSGDSSGSGPHTGVPSANMARALAFSSCMRTHGVTRYPDATSSDAMPDGLAKVSAQELGVSSTQFQVAEAACRRLLPDGGQATPSASQHQLRELVSFARCVRAHGVSNWPDPIRTPVSGPGFPPYIFNLHGLPGLDTRSFSPQITSAMNRCFRLTHLTDADVPWSG